jgi:hypothetical protein
VSRTRPELFQPPDTAADVLDTGNDAGSLPDVKQEEQLRLLSIFHYVVAGLSALFACFPIIHLTLGLFMVFAPETFHNKGDNNAPPAFLGWFLVIFAAMFILIGWTFAAFIFTTGRFLAKRKHYMFCLVMGGIECLFMPFGTVLGVFTIILLIQEPVKQLFQPPNTFADVK